MKTLQHPQKAQHWNSRGHFFGAAAEVTAESLGFTGVRELPTRKCISGGRAC